MLRRVIARGSTLDGTVPESAPTFAQRVGGRWVISWQAYTLGATVNTVLLGLTGGSVGAESALLSKLGGWCAFGAMVRTSGAIFRQEGLAFGCGPAATAHVTVCLHNNDGRTQFHIHDDGQALREPDLPSDACWRSANDGLDLVTTLTY